MSGEKELQFSPKEMQTLALAWQCLETAPKVDYAKLARLTGYTPKSVVTIFGTIRKKLKLLAEAADDTDSTTPAPKTPARNTGNTSKTPKSTGGRKRNGAAAENGDKNGSPTKKTKGAVKPKKEESEDEEDSQVKSEQGD